MAGLGVEGWPGPYLHHCAKHPISLSQFPPLPQVTCLHPCLHGQVLVERLERSGGPRRGGHKGTMVAGAEAAPWDGSSTFSLARWHGAPHTEKPPWLLCAVPKASSAPELCPMTTL